MLENEDRWQQWFFKQAFLRCVCRWKIARQRITKSYAPARLTGPSPSPKLSYVQHKNTRLEIWGHQKSVGAFSPISSR